MDWIDWKNTEAVLEDYAREVKQRYKDELIGNNRVAGGVLLQSIKTYVTKGNTTLAVDMDLASYWKYIEFDTSPVKHPVKGSHILRDAIRNWVRIKQIYPDDRSLVGKVRTRGKFKGKPYTLEELQTKMADNMARLKAKYGRKGTHELETSVKEINALYQQRLEDAISADLGSYTDALIRTLFK